MLIFTIAVISIDFWLIVPLHSYLLSNKINVDSYHTCIYMYLYMIECPLLLCIVPMYVFVFWAGRLYYVINYLITHSTE